MPNLYWKFAFQRSILVRSNDVLDNAVKFVMEIVVICHIKSYKNLKLCYGTSRDVNSQVIYQ